MDSWFKNTGRPALFQALTDACSRFEEDFQSAVEIEANGKAQLEAELQFLQLKLGNVEQLEQQNKVLKEELCQLRKSAQPLLDVKQKQVNPGNTRPSSNRETRTPLSPLALNEVPGLRTSIKLDHQDIKSLSHDDILLEYSTLGNKYERLRSQFSDSIKANEQLRERLREKTKSCDKWIKHAEKLNEQAQARGKRVKQLKAELADATRNPAAGASFASDTGSISEDGRRESIPPLEEAELDRVIRKNLREQSTSEKNNGIAPMDLRKISLASRGDVTGDLFHSRLDNVETPAQTEPNTPNTPMVDSVSSNLDHAGRGVEDETTLPPLPQGRRATFHQVSVKYEPSSDGFIIISERCVRKRKHDDGGSIQTPAARRMKIEDGSDPVVTDIQHHFMPHESIDFDDAERRVATPKKDRSDHSRGQTSRKHPDQEIWTLSKSRQGNRSPTSNRSASSTDDRSLNQASMSAHVQERERAVLDHRKEALHHRAAASDYEEPGLDYGDPPSKSSALRPLDMNRPLPRLLAKKIKSKSLASPSIRESIASLAEDSDEPDFARPAKRRSRRTGRLDNLLNSTTPGPEVIALPTGVQSENIPSARTFHISLPEKRDLPFGKEKRNNKISGALQSPESPLFSNSKRTSTAIQPKKKPGATVQDAPKGLLALRDRPLSDLHLRDFKINPSYNDGLDYAYTEVVRGKDERARLRGCTKEDCCGPFWRGEAKQARGETSTLAFQSLLEHYLGDECWRLASMTNAEKEKMWLEAKTEQLANEHGKCRNKFPRPSSPSGYWNMDMPTTQEELEHRAEAERREKDTIEERWREALRPNGRWLFHDEY